MVPVKGASLALLLVLLLALLVVLLVLLARTGGACSWACVAVVGAAVKEEGTTSAAIAPASCNFCAFFAFSPLAPSSPSPFGRF